jgi:uncharacterized protein YggE
MRTYTLALAAPLVVALTGCRQATPRVTVSGNSPYGQEGIRVGATALVRTRPELAIVTLGCETRSARARDARARNEATISAIIASIEKRGVRRRDIGTVRYSLQRAYRDRGIPEGWVLSNVVEVRVERVEQAADIIDGATEAGANVIESVRYEVRELRNLREEAIAQACSVAKQKADRIAREMGVRRGKLVAFTDQTVQAYSPWGFGLGRNGMANAQSVVQAGGSEEMDATPDRQLSGGNVAVHARIEAVFGVD